MLIPSQNSVKGFPSMSTSAGEGAHYRFLFCHLKCVYSSLIAEDPVTVRTKMEILVF